MSRTALITGASGFIGGRLAERLLAEGYAVHALVRPGSDVSALAAAVEIHRYQADVEQLKEIVQAARPDIVFHLATFYIADHKSDQIANLIESNIHFPIQLAEAMSAAGISRLVNVGTASQHYGTREFNPVSLYAATKQACSDLLLYYHGARGLSLITLKLFDTFSEGDTRRRLVQLLVGAANSGEKLNMSPGEQVLDLTHVEDVVTGFLIAADRLFESDRPVNEEYFLSGERHSVKGLVAVIEKALGRPVPVEFGASPYRPREVMLPVEPKPTEVLPGWRKQRSLAEVIPRLRVQGAGG